MANWEDREGEEKEERGGKRGEEERGERRGKNDDVSYLSYNDIFIRSTKEL